MLNTFQTEGEKLGETFHASAFTLDVAPGLEAPGGLVGLRGSRSSRGGTGGKTGWGAADSGEGGLSTWNKPNHSAYSYTDTKYSR